MVGQTIDAQGLIKEIVDKQGGRFRSFLTQFADGFQATKLEMHKWLLYPILKSSIGELEMGLRQREIRRVLQQKHPQGEGLNPGNVTQALQSVATLQNKKDVKPIILDYDQTNLRLQVVDRSFLIWLASQRREELLEDLGLPCPVEP